MEQPMSVSSKIDSFFGNFCRESNQSLFLDFGGLIIFLNYARKQGNFLLYKEELFQ